MDLNQAKCTTDGSGCWSNHKRTVILKNAEVTYCADDKKFGELRVYFDKRTWNVKQHGLIYTDRQFIKEFRLVLQKLGFSAEESKINYSEQGMQGDDYISLDVGEMFLKAYDRIKD